MHFNTSAIYLEENKIKTVLSIPRRFIMSPVVHFHQLIS
jgi:hypothetical protein